METPTQKLIAALRERLNIIGDIESRAKPDAHMERLRVVSEKIDRLVKGLPEYIDPQLNHFLTRHSYDKALEMLERLESQSPGS